MENKNKELDERIETLFWLCESKTLKRDDDQFRSYHDMIVRELVDYEGDRFDEFKNRLYRLEQKK